jgi:DNA-binding SARP family transcriptional activator
MHSVMTSPRSAHRPRPKAVALGRLSLRLSGRFESPAGDGYDLEPKDALLLAYLALEGPTPRARLAAMLWPDVEEERARGNLRQRLLRLKRATRLELVTGGAEAQLADAVDHDLDHTHELLQTIEPEQAAGLSDWLDAQRERRRRARVESLAAAAAEAQRTGDFDGALAHANAIVELDVLSEEAHRLLMRLHYLRGDAAAAVAAYQRCARLLRSDLGVEPSRETLQLKAEIERGLPGEVAAGSRRTVPIALLRPPLLIGRAADLHALEDAWLHGRAVLLVGEAGSGKSRLLEEFVAADDGRVIVDARPGDSTLPLALAARVTRVIAARFPTVTEATAWSRLTAVLPGFGKSAPPATAQRPQRLGTEIGSVLKAAAVAGFSGLVIDDLQYSDPSSIEVLTEVVESAGLQSIRWLFASRPPEGAEAVRSLSAVRDTWHAEERQVQPFDEAALRAFVDSLRVFDDADTLATQLLRRVGGNAMFVLEALRQVHASGSRDIQAPARAFDLMDRRLRSMSEAALALVRIAAVAADDFSPELAEAVSGLGPLALATPWHELEAAHILESNAFTHDLVFEAAGRTLPASIARRLHAKVADFLERSGGEPARIAQHRLEAGQETEAVPHLLAAARRAWAAGRGTETGNLFMRAAEIERAAGRSDVAFDILFECADAVSEVASVEMLERVVETARPLARTPQQLTALRLCDAVGCHLRKDIAGFTRLNDDALLMAIASGHARVEAEARFGRAVVDLSQGRLQSAVENLRAAVTVARMAGLERRAVAMESGLSALLAMAGMPAQAVVEQRRLGGRVELVESNQAALAAGYRTAAAFLTGDFSRCTAEVDTALALIRTVDLTTVDRLGVGRDVISCLARLGRYRVALAIAEEVFAPIDPQNPAFGSLADERARIYLDLGRTDLAEKWLKLVEQPIGGDVRRERRACIVRGYAQLVAGKDPLPMLERPNLEHLEELILAWDWMMVRGHSPGTREVAARCDALIDRCQAGGAAGLEAPLRALRAQLLLDVGERERAREAAIEALPLMNEGRMAARLPSAALWLARALLGADRRNEAAVSIRAGVDWLHRTADEQVPPEFRDSFLNRHPVNRELLTLATRLQ